MRIDVAGARGEQLEGADDPRCLVGHAGLVVVPHPVHVERGLAVGDEHSVVEPLVEQIAGVLVSVATALLGGEVDVHHIPRRTGAEHLPLVVVDHVIRRCGHLGEVEPLGVIKDSGEGLEAGHGA